MARTKKVPNTKEKTGKSKNVLLNTTRKRRKDHAFKEIVKYQKSCNHLIPNAPFARLVRMLLEEAAGNSYGFLNGQSLKITKECLVCLHEACEIYLTTYFEDLNLLARHATRVTVMVRDIEALKYLKRSNSHGHL